MSRVTSTRQGRAVEDSRPWDRPLVFWRETDGRRTGLACLTTFCDNPDCTCQEAHLQAFEVDDRFVKLSVHDNHVKVVFDHGGGPTPTGQASAVVDLESGRLERMERARPRKRMGEFRRWLEEAVDQAVLEDLRARWRGYKQALKRADGPGLAQIWRDQDWTEWDGEEPVGWLEVHPETAEDRYRLDGETYEAMDFYCLLPECDCGEVTVRFGRVVKNLVDEVIGEVFVDADSNEVVGTTNAPGNRRLLDRLWEVYEASHNLAELGRRSLEMQRIGPEIHALRERQLRPIPARRDAKIGRNEPCPCGSGRKYKKCCGRRS